MKTRSRSPTRSRNWAGISKTKQELTLTIKQSCPVCLDRNIFRQAFANILYNAIQCSAEKTAIQILVDKAQDSCFVEIVDSGTGIAQEHEERIFDRFYRVDKSSTVGKGSAIRISLPEQQQAKWPTSFSLTEADLS